MYRYMYRHSAHVLVVKGSQVDRILLSLMGRMSSSRRRTSSSRSKQTLGHDLSGIGPLFRIPSR